MHFLNNSQRSGPTLPSTEDNPRIVLFGIECHFTSTVLTGLLDNGIPIVAVCLPGPPHIDGLLRSKPPGPSIDLVNPNAGPSSVLQTATRHGIPVYRTGNLKSRTTVNAINNLTGDLVICACFTRLLPAAIYSRHRYGGLNLHPSMLPDKRGPDPIFWTFKEGIGQSGMTIHKLDRRFDTGDIVAQQPITYADGTTEAELDRNGAQVAVSMLADILPGLVQGSLPLHPQNDERATNAPFPHPHDYLVDQTRSARAAFNFVRGLAGRGHPFKAEHQGRAVRIINAISYDNEGVRSGATFEYTGVARLQFSPGILIAEIEPWH